MNAAKEPELWTELLRLGAAFGRRMLEEKESASYAPNAPPAAPYPRALTAQPCPLPQDTPDPRELPAPRPSTAAMRLQHPTSTVHPTATSALSADGDGPTLPGGLAYGPARRRSRSLRWNPSALPLRPVVPTPPARPLSFEDLCSRVRAL